MSLSDYTEGKILDDIFGIAAFSIPATVYIALFTDATDDAGGGTEVTGGSYARIAVTNDNTEWSRTVSTVDNDNAITFPEATADWGTITNFAIFDAISGGNQLMHGTLAVSKPVSNGDTFKFAAGNVNVSLD